MPKTKVKKRPLIVGNGRVHALRALPDNLIRFSFRHFQETGKFGVHLAKEGYLETLIHRLRDVSQLTLSEFRANKDRSLRAHTHDWSRTTEQAGFAHLNEQMRECEPWQFELSVNAHGRIHGLLIDEVFYVVWVDPAHHLYAAPR